MFTYLLNDQFKNYSLVQLEKIFKNHTDVESSDCLDFELVELCKLTFSDKEWRYVIIYFDTDYSEEELAKSFYDLEFAILNKLSLKFTGRNISM